MKLQYWPDTILYPIHWLKESKFIECIGTAEHKKTRLPGKLPTSHPELNASHLYCMTPERFFFFSIFSTHLLHIFFSLQVSNFLLFQMAYTELFFVDKLWPDITREDVLDIFEAYKTRERRCVLVTSLLAGVAAVFHVQFTTRYWHTLCISASLSAATLYPKCFLSFFIPPPLPRPPRCVVE